MQAILPFLIPHMKYNRGLFHLPSSLQWVFSIGNLKSTFVLTQTPFQVVPELASVLAAAEVREEQESAKEGN